MKIKSIISKVVIFGMTGVLLVANTSSCKKDKHKHNPTALRAPEPPNGYPRNEYQQLWKFFIQNSSEPGKNNLAIIKEHDRDFLIEGPLTWQYSPLNEDGSRPQYASGQGILFYDRNIDHSRNNVDKKLEDILLYNPIYSKLSGTLDLSGCQTVENINLHGTHIKEIKLSKYSPCGKNFWTIENFNNTDINHYSTSVSDLFNLQRDLSPPEAGRQLTNIHNILRRTLRNQNNNPILGADEYEIKVILVD